MGDAIVSGLSDAWSSIATFVPKLLGFLVILFIGWLIAKGLSKAVGLVLTKSGFPKLIERAGLGDMLSKSSVDVGGVIVKLVYYFVLLIALQFAFSAFGPNPVGDLLSQIVTFLPRIVVAIVLVVIAAAIASAVRDLVTGALGRRPFTPLLGNITYGFLLALGVIAALNQIGVATTVTTPVLVTVLATVGGILVIGVGGGLIRPMQKRWEGWLDSAEKQVAADRGNGQHAAAAAEPAREDATTSNN